MLSNFAVKRAACSWVTSHNSFITDSTLTTLEFDKGYNSKTTHLYIYPDYILSNHPVFQC